MNRFINILSNSKDVFFYTFAFGLVAHGFVFFNEFYSHDSLFFEAHSNVLIGLGRWGQSVLYQIRGQVFPPTLIGFFSLLLLALTTTLFLDLFGIKRKLNIIVVCGVLTTSFVITIIAATYIFFLDANMLALFFAVLSCSIIKYISKIVYRIVFASIFLWLSLSLYQAYFQVYTLLCCLFVLFGCINGKRYKDIFKEIGEYLVILFVSLVLYKLSVVISLEVTSVHSLSTGYNTIESVEDFISLKHLLLLTFNTVPNALKNIVAYPSFFKTSAKIELLLINSFIAMYFIYLQTKNNRYRLFLSQLLFIVFVPFFANTVFILSKGLMHNAMEYSYTIVVLVPLLIAINAQNHGVRISEKKWNALTCIICTVLSLLIFSNTVFSNQAYLKKELESKSSLSIATRILDRIEQQPKFEPNKTRVCFIGDANMNPYFMVDRVKIEGKKKRATGLGYYLSFTYNTAQYYKTIMGVILPGCDYTKLDMEYVNNLPLFPSSDSVQLQNDQVIVKLGYNHEW